MIDVILLAPNVYSVLTSEFDAVHPDSDKTKGFAKTYYFRNIFCQWANIPENHVRFISDSKAVTRIFNPNQGGILNFIRLYSGAMNAALSEMKNDKE